ncbi:MAG: DUF4276 family protein [bacterium]|nr:DUF4276 family protein [bacterium]
MRVVKFLVEGQTEQSFVNSVLYPYLLQLDISIVPILTGKNKMGGVQKYGGLKRDLKILLGESQKNIITTMIDFYNLRDDFPGYKTMPRSNCYLKVKHLEEAWQAEVSQPHFIPYLQLHEFEALLFSSIDDIHNLFSDKNKLADLQSITSQFNNPEEINEGNNTSPAKRLKSLYPEYQKPLAGVSISKKIGLSKMRDNCRHFNEWLTKLENLRDS